MAKGNLIADLPKNVKLKIGQTKIVPSKNRVIVSK
jgi:hypothetical protein